MYKNNTFSLSQLGSLTSAKEVPLFPHCFQVAKRTTWLRGSFNFSFNEMTFDPPGEDSLLMNLKVTPQQAEHKVKSLSHNNFPQWSLGIIVRSVPWLLGPCISSYGRKSSTYSLLVQSISLMLQDSSAASEIISSQVGLWVFSRLFCHCIQPMILVMECL